MALTAALTAADLIARSVLKVQDVVVPAWDATVTIQEVSAGAMIRMREEHTGPDGKVRNLDFSKALVQASLIAPRFSAGDMDALFEGGAGWMPPLLDAINALNGTTEAAAKEAEFPVHE